MEQFFFQLWVIGCPLSSLWVAIELNVWEGSLECPLSSGNTQLALQIIKRNQLLPMTVQRISPDSRKKPLQPLHSVQPVQLPSSFTQVQRKWTSLAACDPVTCFLSTSVPPKMYMQLLTQDKRLQFDWGFFFGLNENKFYLLYFLQCLFHWIEAASTCLCGFLTWFLAITSVITYICLHKAVVGYFLCSNKSTVLYCR